jgi:hypothetical protein
MISLTDYLIADNDLWSMGFPREGHRQQPVMRAYDYRADYWGKCATSVTLTLDDVYDRVIEEAWLDYEGSPWYVTGRYIGGRGATIDRMRLHFFEETDAVMFRLMGVPGRRDQR